MRIVFDSNVLIAAFAARGLCESLLETCLSGHEVVLSDEILLEVEKALRRKIRVPETTAKEVVRLLRSHASIAQPLTLDPKECRDFTDLHVLGLAPAANVEAIVTGDEDLKLLRQFRDIPIFSPRQLWERLRAGR